MAEGMQQAGNLRKVLKKVITTEINRQRPDIRIGRVWSVDLGSQIAQVLFPGNTNLVPAHFGLDKIPTNTVLGNLDPSVDIESISDYSEVAGTTNADVVRVAGKPKDWFILDFIQGSPGKADSVFDDDLNSDIFFTQDYGIATGNTDTPIRLKYLPIGDSSVKVSGPGVGLNRDEWDFDPDDPWTIIVPRQDHFHEGEVFEAHYAWTDPAQRPPHPASLTFIGATSIPNGQTTVDPPDGCLVGDLFVFVASAGVSFGVHDTTCTDARVIDQLVTEPEAGHPWPLKQGVAYGILSTLDPVTVSVSASDNTIFAYLAVYRYTGTLAATLGHGDLTNTAPVACEPALAAGDVGVVAVATEGGTLSASGWTSDVSDTGIGVLHAAGESSVHVTSGGGDLATWTALTLGFSDD